MGEKPKKSNNINKRKICENCAWASRTEGDLKYYCYYYDEDFKWEFTRKRDNGGSAIYLNMTPCRSFHSIPSDMKRGAEFAKYFQNKRQIEASSTRSWWSIVIAVIATIVSIIALFIKNQ